MSARSSDLARADSRLRNALDSLLALSADVRLPSRVRQDIAVQVERIALAIADIRCSQIDRTTGKG